MLFCSQAYLIFFSVIFIAYWSIPWQRPRVWLLLVASFYFYASWNKWLALLIGVCTTVDYVLARGMDFYSAPRVRKTLLFISIASNLGLLCYFKYANFFLASLQEALAAAGMQTSMPVLQVILPIGISFYTFEAINYTVDVYRKHAPAETNLANFMLFITFFPHLVAGPIVRARDFLPQIHKPKKWDWLRLQLGAQLFLMGMFKKLVVADRMALLSDPVFADPAAFKTSAAWLAVFAYAMQVYCDFSGYSDMALGSAHMLGYKLAQNFNMPYIARNVSDFWNRWHMSLSSWLRDYLFVPLGGSRHGTRATTRNLFITMTLCGLWHGANWNFVLFGMVQGLLLIGHRTFRAMMKHRPGVQSALLSQLGTAACIAFTFFLFSMSLVVFRSEGVANIGVMFSKLFTPSLGAQAPIHALALLLAYGTVFGGYFVGRMLPLRTWQWRLPGPVVGLGYSAALSMVLVLTPASGQAFIYFQF